MCESFSSFKVVYSSGSWSQTKGSGFYDAAFQCQNAHCGAVIGGVKPAKSGVDGEELTDYWPKHVGGKDFPEVPEHIAAAGDEAHRCLSIDANRAAVAMARAVVEATAKDHGITKGNLDAKIKQMAKDGLIGDDTAKAAHAVRLWGNDAAHGDLALEPLDRVDAEEVVALMDEVLNRTYQSPARVQRIMESREARRQGEAGGVEEAQR